MKKQKCFFWSQVLVPKIEKMPNGVQVYWTAKIWRNGKKLPNLVMKVLGLSWRFMKDKNIVTAFSLYNDVYNNSIIYL